MKTNEELEDLPVTLLIGNASDISIQLFAKRRRAEGSPCWIVYEAAQGFALFFWNERRKTEGGFDISSI